MRTWILGAVAGVVLSTVGASLVAAPEQSLRPGDIAPPNVWVQNRSADEAIPVAMPDGLPPLRVQVTNPQPVRVEVVDTRPIFKTGWDYMQVRIAANQDAASVLNAYGGGGWETTGITLPTQGGVLVVLKRPR